MDAPCVVPDPHHRSTGEWSCYRCGRLLKGSYLRPILPWEHREDPTPPADATKLPGLGTTE